METLLVNIGLLVLIILWVAAVFVIPVTAAMLVSGLYLEKVGVGGYFITSDPGGLALVAMISLGIAVDIILWKEFRRYI